MSEAVVTVRAGSVATAVVETIFDGNAEVAIGVSGSATVEAGCDSETTVQIGTVANAEVAAGVRIALSLTRGPAVTLAVAAGVTGPPGPPGPPGGVNSLNTRQGDVVLTLADVPNYIHTQGTPIATWAIVHNLGQFPAVTTVDSLRREVVGRVSYTDANTIVVAFTAAFSGYAYLS